MQARLPDGSIMISGVLPKDAEYKTVGDKNCSLTKFSVKVGERPSPEVGEKPVAVWVSCQCWHSLARGAKALKKGDSVLCVGKIESREYEGKEYKTLNCEFVCASIPETAETAAPASQPLPPDLSGFEEILTDGSIPF